MNQHTSINNRPHQSGHTDSVNIRKMMMMITSKWYYFIFGLIIALVAAFFYIKYTIPTYRVSSTILIEEGDQRRITGLDNNMLEGFGLSPAARNMDNQIIVLTSWTLIRQALNELPFETDCYRKGLFKTVSYYPMNPIELVPGPEGKVPYNTEFIFEYYEGNVFHISTGRKSEIPIDTFISFGQMFSTDRGSFTILPNPELENIYKSKGKIYFKFYDREALIGSYRSRLEVVPTSKEASIIDLNLTGTNRVKDMMFLDKLIEVFMRNNLDKKNHEASRIIEFIDAQLVDVTDSLMITENQLQDFRSRNMIMDVSAQTQRLIDQAVDLENEKARLKLESNYYKYLDEYLSKENNQEVPISPATMGIQDPLLGRLMQELAGLQAEYYSSSVGEKNPLQAQLELRIRNTKQSLRETLQGIMLANSMAIEENNNQIKQLNKEASRLPIKERQLLGIERKFNLNNVLYTFLLQKRAEAQIQKASNRPDNEVIDPARPSGIIKPNRKMIYYYAISLGLIIPLLLLVIGDVINTKISSEEDLKTLTSLPVTGHIPHSRLSYNTVVLTEPQSTIAEAFRSLRTRMEFFTREAKNPVILVSSTGAGEGKTFAAINLASAYSLADKKTLLIGFDLRRPTLSKSFEMNGTIGLSNYLIGKSTINNIIFETAYPNLYLIPSGPIPPNPGELSTSEKTDKLIKTLKEHFDFIIVDSAPIGTVSDNFSLAALADATLIVVRHGQTRKPHLNATISEVQVNGIKGLSLVINDFPAKRGSYRYAYSYRYGSKYVQDAK